MLTGLSNTSDKAIPYFYGKEKVIIVKDKITKILMNTSLVLISAYFIYRLIDPYKPRGMLKSQLIVWCLVFAALAVMIMKIADSNKPNRKAAIQGLDEFKYPAVEKKLMSKKPTGVVFGKYKNRYVCKKPDEDGHVIILGGSGSGKSSTVIIPMLLSNEDVGSFCIDIKGELSYKASDYADSNTVIFNPLDRFSYGYDVFYALNDNSSSQEVYEVVQNVVYSLINLSASEKNPFWKNSARALLMGLMINYYKKGTKNFIDIIDLILSKPLKEQIEDVINEGNTKSNEYKLLIQFKDLADDTLSGIVVELVNSINLFSTDNDIRYSFRDNPKKFNPLMIEEQKHIFIVIEEHKLIAYNQVLHIIINQALSELEKRPENSKQVLFIIDELARILSSSKIERLLDAARTLRSRKVNLILATQSLDSLMIAYSEKEVQDLVANCSYKVILDASNPATEKEIIGWCGKYKARKKSWNTGDKVSGKGSISYEETDIVTEADLMQLRNTGELILISPYGYNRLKKVPYYEDRYLKEISDKYINNNDVIKHR